MIIANVRWPGGRIRTAAAPISNDELASRPHPNALIGYPSRGTAAVRSLRAAQRRDRTIGPGLFTGGPIRAITGCEPLAIEPRRSASGVRTGEVFETRTGPRVTGEPSGPFAGASVTTAPGS